MKAKLTVLVSTDLHYFNISSVVTEGHDNLSIAFSDNKYHREWDGRDSTVDQL